MTSHIICAAPRFARVKEAQTVFDILTSCRFEIPLPESFCMQQVSNGCKLKQYWVVESDQAIAGVMRLIANDIFFLAVSPEYRKRGIARSLIAYAKKRWQSLTAKTRNENAPTIALLESEGFERDYSALVLNSEWISYAWVRPGRHKFA